MPRKDTTDFVAAFAIGTVLGIGATLLLRGEESRSDRIARQLRPHRRRLARGADEVRRGVRRGAGATGDLTTEAISAGRELLGEFREEVAEILADARDELTSLAGERVRGARRAARRAGKKLRG